MKNARATVDLSMEMKIQDVMLDKDVHDMEHNTISAINTKKEVDGTSLKPVRKYTIIEKRIGVGTWKSISTINLAQ